jgi:ATP-dependent Zn protease
MDRIAALTVGFSGADLENLVNEAALLCGRENRETVNMESLLNARDKVVLGGKRELIISDEEKTLVAYHEAGHALVASQLPTADPLDKVSIIPRGRALGVTEQIPEEEHYNLRKTYLHDRIGVMLGGRAAEQLVRRSKLRCRRRSQAGNQAGAAHGNALGDERKNRTGSVSPRRRAHIPGAGNDPAARLQRTYGADNRR